MDANLLHVIIPFSNPRRFKTRLSLLKKAIYGFVPSGAQIHVIECAFGNRPFELDGQLPSEVDHIKVRTSHELWLKENLINVAVTKLPLNWEYVAWVDGDIEFVNPYWAEETVRVLQHHPVVQMFSHVMDIGPKFEAVKNTTNEIPTMVDNGFAYAYHHQMKFPEDVTDYNVFWHPGFAWAATRDAWNTFGGLIDRSICGAADHQMAWSLLGMGKRTIHGGMPKSFEDYILTWEHNAKPLHHQMGFVHGVILHYWHGRRKLRKYRERWQILVDAGFNPYTHVKYDSHGVLQLCEPNSKMMRDLQFYFSQRNEDSIDVE